jgi:hypothetical protein
LPFHIFSCLNSTLNQKKNTKEKKRKKTKQKKKKPLRKLCFAPSKRLLLVPMDLYQSLVSNRLVGIKTAKPKMFRASWAYFGFLLS